MNIHVSTLKVFPYLTITYPTQLVLSSQNFEGCISNRNLKVKKRRSEPIESILEVVYVNYQCDCQKLSNTVIVEDIF
jgi:hypothetical protein